MARLVTNAIAITDMSQLDIASLSAFFISATSGSLTFTQSTGNYVVFHGAGISLEGFGNVSTQRITGYDLFLSGINTQHVTGLDLGPGEFEAIYSGAMDMLKAQDRFWRGDDILTGGNYSDHLEGHAGNDRISGGGELDHLSGGLGNDTIYGGGGNDVVEGDQGNDVLYGNGSDDELRGGAGNDTLTGGTGFDMLLGGAGRDVFVYTSLKDAPLFLNDMILDFQRGHDRIDLHLVDAQAGVAGDQAFRFIGTKDFTHHKGELRIYKSGFMVEGDVTGDGKPDFHIEVDGAASLSKFDFVL